METSTEHAIINIRNKAEFDTLVQESKIPVLLDLWAVWCSPCRMQSPILEDVVSRVGAKALVAKANVDEVKDVAGAFGVSSIPTLIIFDQGKEKERFIGMQSAEVLLEALGCPGC